jgi:hypothetical protein
VVCRAGGNTSAEYGIYNFAGTTSVEPYSVESDRSRNRIWWSYDEITELR